ncbi:MAG: hypothetical protein WD037_11355 [Balneolales bacterium]
MKTHEKKFYTELKNHQKSWHLHSHITHPENKKDIDATDFFLRMLSNKQKHTYGSLSEELSSLSKVVSKIADSIDENILDEEEASVLIRHMFSAFLSRRMDNMVDHLFANPQSNWFLAAKTQHYEKEKR